MLMGFILHEPYRYAMFIAGPYRKNSMAVRLVEKPEPKVPVVALVPPELLKQINQIAAREERSRSSVVAMALRDFVERDNLRS